MNPLIIEYVTEGRQRGYNFTSPTQAYDETTLKMIWRNAMPRGQGWSSDVYAGARSLKCFAVDDRRLALADVTVTGQRDESGRSGIRRAAVQVMDAETCAAHLRDHLRGYTPAVRDMLAQLPSPRQWRQIVDRLLPAFGKDRQLVLSQPYARQRWQIMEGLIIKLALSLQVGLPRYQGVIPFTTLALDVREELPIVGLPEGRNGNGRDDAVEISF